MVQEIKRSSLKELAKALSETVFYQ